MHSKQDGKTLEYEAGIVAGLLNARIFARARILQFSARCDICAILAGVQGQEKSRTFCFSREKLYQDPLQKSNPFLGCSYIYTSI